MPTGYKDVRFRGKTGSGRTTVKVMRLDPTRTSGWLLWVTQRYDYDLILLALRPYVQPLSLGRQGDQMRRREFTTGMLLTAVPWLARAQQRATQHPIAIFPPAIPPTLLHETGGGSA